LSGPAIIIGASHGGVQAAASLRQQGWEEEIVLLSAEDALPYHRPPLSKAFLSGEKAAEDILLRGADFYAGQGIKLETDLRVDGVDPVARRIRMGARSLSYGALILATGARARRPALDGLDWQGVHLLRDIADARQLKAALADAGRVVIIGGGFIGLEVAATAIKAGKSVTVLEMQDRILARAFPAALSHWLAKQHRAAGVDMRLNCAVDRLEGEAGRLRAVRLADGTRLDADLVLIGIGSEAANELAWDAGLSCVAGGIRVDEACRSSTPDIFALGDCASQFNRFAGAVTRIESVQNAADQARIVANVLTGKAPEEPGANWFWTDQYALKIQMAGLVLADCPVTVRGEPDSGTFSLLQMQRGRIVAAFSVNRPADHMTARRLIAAGTRLDPILAADGLVPLAKAVLVAEKAA